MKWLLAITVEVVGHAAAHEWLSPLVGFVVTALLIGAPCFAVLAAWQSVQRNEDARAIDRYRRGQSALRAVAEPNPTTRSYR